MMQNEVEWIEYENTIKDIIESSQLPGRIFYDLRGNHDSFGVPVSGGDYDFYEKYSINAKLRRQGRVQSITLEVSLSSACLQVCGNKCVALHFIFSHLHLIIQVKYIVIFSSYFNSFAYHSHNVW
jgi:hypothetical protein